MSRLQKIVGALVVLAVVLFLAAPLLLSSSLVKNRIEGQLSQLSGHSVFLAGDSSLSIYPYLGVTYGRLTIGQANTSTPLMLADGIEARVGLLSALTGKPQVTAITLVKPRLYLEVSKDGTNNWTHQRLAADEQGQPVQTRPVETIKITDGTIAYRNNQNGRSGEIRAIHGNFSWPGTLSPLTIDVVAGWRGKPVDLSASISGPVELMDGKVSALKFTTGSELLNVAFTGNAAVGADPLLTGAVKITSPDLQKASVWLNQPIGLASLLTSIELSGALKAGSKKVDLSDASLVVGDHKAFGRLQLEQAAGNRVSIGGTLAFDTLELPNLRTLAQTDGPPLNQRISQLLSANVDLRISAESAVSGDVTFENLAATALVTLESASFDIGQAQAFDGIVSGTLGIPADENSDIGIKLSMQDIALGQLSDSIGETPIKIAGNGNAKLAARINRAFPEASFRHLNGEGSIESSEGTLQGINLATVLARPEAAQSLRSPDVLKGTTPYDNMSITFHIANGILFLKETMLKSPDFESSVQGRSDLVTQSLALSGTVSQTPPPSTDGGETSILKAPFFIGGTIQTPFFTGLSRANSSLSDNKQ